MPGSTTQPSDGDRFMYHKKLPRSTNYLPHLTLLGATLVILTTMFVYNNNSSPIQIAEVAAPNPKCSAEFNIPRPSPTPSPSPSPSPITSSKPRSSPIASSSPSSPTPACDVQFTLPDTPVCWTRPRRVRVSYKVNSLPPGGPYYMQTDWYIASPIAGPNNYRDTQRIYPGKYYTTYAYWPGIPDGERRTVEIHLGLNVVDRSKNIITNGCSDGLDFYWTPYVLCP